jgi:hypothetical protein
LTFLKVITFKPAYVKAKEAIMNTKPTAGEQEIEAALEQFSEEFLQSW